MLVLCALIISLSASGRALSLDALITTYRHGRVRLSMRSEPAVAYSLPLRLCWLMFGVSYFFPGLFKAIEAGDLWISGEAIAGHMTSAIATRAGFSPIFPLYDYPLLSSFFGIGTFVFELGFVFLLFSYRFSAILALRPFSKECRRRRDSGGSAPHLLMTSRTRG